MQNLISFTVDKNDPSDLKKHISLLQDYRRKRLRALGYSQAKFHLTKYNFKTVMVMIDSILDANIDSCFDETSQSRNYYVYLHCNPLEEINVRHDVREVFLASKFNVRYRPFYVGKGTGNRYLDFNRNDSHRKIRTSIIRKDKEVASMKIKENLSEVEALSLESKLIDILGLKVFSPGGYLVNLDEGGEPVKRRSLYPKSAHRLLELNKLRLR